MPVQRLSGQHDYAQLRLVFCKIGKLFTNFKILQVCKNLPVEENIVPLNGKIKWSKMRDTGTIWRTAVIEGETVVVFLTGDWRVMSIRKEYSTFWRGMQI